MIMHYTHRHLSFEMQKTALIFPGGDPLRAFVENIISMFQRLKLLILRQEMYLNSRLYRHLPCGQIHLIVVLSHAEFQSF